MLNRMLLKAQSIEEITQRLREASVSGKPVTGYDITALNRVLEHTPEDMTVTVEAGITLAALQSKLAERGQFLPIDPPSAATLTIGALLATNANGPRRFGYGTIRDHLIGIKVVLADGKLIKAGGKVVKNVAGYDLCKLFVGSRGTLGVIVEATFKLQPLPEAEATVKASFSNVAEAGKMVEKVLASELTPVVLDLHNLDKGTTTVLHFAGVKDDVAWLLERAKAIGICETGTLAYAERFWEEDGSPIRSASVLPSDLPRTIAQLSPARFVARAGNGVVYYRGGQLPPKADLPHQLFARVKETYDPKGILPGLNL